MATPGAGVSENAGPVSFIDDGIYITAPALVDLDLDGNLEVVMLRDDGNPFVDELVAYSLSGNTFDVATVDSASTDRLPAIADVGGSLHPEVFLGNESGEVRGFDHLLQPLASAALMFFCLMFIFFGLLPVLLPFSSR